MQKRLKKLEINFGIKKVHGEAYESSKEPPENPSCLPLRLPEVAETPPRIAVRGRRRDRLFALQHQSTVNDLRRFGLLPRSRLDPRFEPFHQTTPAISYRPEHRQLQVDFLVGKWRTRNLGEWPILFGRDWSIGFGRDKVTGSFKIVKICYSHPAKECAVLDVETGDWRKLGLPCYVHRLRNNSACVNGSIYWLYKDGDYKLLALDLHKEEFHDVVSVPAMFLTWNTQIVNLEGRLAIAQVGPDWILEILTMDAEEERWSKTYSITLPPTSESDSLVRRFRPLALSKQGNLVLCDNCNMLYKYYPETDKIHCLSSHSHSHSHSHYYRVISPYLENLVPLPLKSSHPVPILGKVSLL